MITPLQAIGSLWLVWLVGWMLAALTAAESVVRQSGRGRLTHGLLVVVGAILVRGRHPRLAPLLRPVYPLMPWVAWTGAVLCAIGLAFAVWARVQIGRFWSGSVALAALLGLPFLFAGLFVKLKQEERLLLERFGPEYEKYRAEVPALIPRL